ncbi:hypothetical protein JCM11641_000768 [Rhodosporidiobolus odoratus]
MGELATTLQHALHAHANGSSEDVDHLLRPLPIARHSKRNSFTTWAEPILLQKTPPPQRALTPAELCTFFFLVNLYCGRQRGVWRGNSSLFLASSVRRTIHYTRAKLIIPLPSTFTPIVLPLPGMTTDPPPPHLSPLPTPPRSLSPNGRASSPRKSARRLSPSRLGISSQEDGALPETELLGRLQVQVVEAKGLAVQEGSKAYVLLQYDRTDSVSREWGAPLPEKEGKEGKKSGIRHGQPRKSSGGTTTRRIVGGLSSSTSSNGDYSAIASAFGSSNSSSTTSPNSSTAPLPSTGEISSLPSQTLSNGPPKYQPSATLRPVSPSPPTLPPELIGTAQNPIWNHEATFDVVSRGRTLLVCVYDKLAPQGGLPTRAHGFAGAAVFEPPLLETNEGEEGGWLDVWVPLTSALDETIGGEIRLRLLFEPLTTRPKLSVTSFQLLRLIGQGSFGQVFRVRKRDTKRIYALKVIRKASVGNDPRALKQVLTERKVLEMNNMSPFLCGLKMGFQDERCFFFCLDYKGGGEMFQHMQRDGGRFDEAKVRFYVAEIVLALEFLHAQGVVYRDLKPENCLLDGSGHVVLCDFGLSKILVNEPEEKTRTLCGTTSFLAPEVLLDVGYTYSADWWSLGVLTFEMMFGWSPFYAETKLEEYERILSAEIKIPNKKGYGEEGKDFVRRLLTRDVPSRLGSSTGALEIQQHPFFSTIDWPRLALRQVAPPFKPPTHADDDQPDFYDDGRQWRFDFDCGNWDGQERRDSEGVGGGVGGGGGGKERKSQCGLVRGFTFRHQEPTVKPWNRLAKELWGNGDREGMGMGMGENEGEGEEVKKGVMRKGGVQDEVERFKQGEMGCGTRRSSCG